MMKFHRRLKSLRKERGWSMYRVAKLSGLSIEGISNLEEPKSDPKLSTLVKLAEAFGITVVELLTEKVTTKTKGDNT